MAKRSLPLAKVYALIGPGPLVLLSTAHDGRSNVMPMSWYTMLEFEPPPIDECSASLACRVVDTDMVARYPLFVVQVVKARVDPLRRDHQTIHHLGCGRFMIAGETIRLRSRMR